jgi:site-specific DNA recombinase
VENHVARVEVQPERLLIRLSKALKGDRQRAAINNALHVPWHKTVSKRRREVLLSSNTPPEYARPIRSETRATLVASIARGRRWLKELIDDTTATADSIARRERCSVRKVNMTLSLAFIAPDLVRAAIEGRLPRGMGVTRFADLPAEWSRQHQILELPAGQ